MEQRAGTRGFVCGAVLTALGFSIQGMWRFFVLRESHLSEWVSTTLVARS